LSSVSEGSSSQSVRRFPEKSRPREPPPVPKAAFSAESSISSIDEEIKSEKADIVAHERPAARRKGGWIAPQPESSTSNASKRSSISISVDDNSKSVEDSNSHSPQILVERRLSSLKANTSVDTPSSFTATRSKSIIVRSDDSDDYANEVFEPADEASDAQYSNHADDFETEEPSVKFASKNPISGTHDAYPAKDKDSDIIPDETDIPITIYEDFDTANYNFNDDDVYDQWLPCATNDGTIYYYNQYSEVSAWNIPAGHILADGVVHGHWMEILDENWNIFYHNTATGYNGWEMTDEGDLEADDGYNEGESVSRKSVSRSGGDTAAHTSGKAIIERNVTIKTNSKLTISESDNRFLSASRNYK
jgi:hypothetical protein